MTHWIVAPIVLPALLAPFIVLAARYHIGIQRVCSVAGVVGLIAIGAALAWQVSDGSVIYYRLSDWAAPFGIVVVGDRLSTMMVLLTSAFSLIFAYSQWESNNELRLCPTSPFTASWISLVWPICCDNLAARSCTRGRVFRGRRVLAWPHEAERLPAVETTVN